MKILVVIPAFNEEATIAGVVRAAKELIHDVMVIDDGSEDTTTFTAMMEGAMVHRLKDNMGKGEALKAAFEYAVQTGYDWVITLDGDGQHDPRDIANFIPLFDDYDLILGNRTSDADRAAVLRRIASLLLNIAVSVVSWKRIYDSQIGFRAYSRRLLESVELRSSHFDMETEVVIKAARRGFRIGHARIRAIYAGEVSRFHKVKDSGRFIAVLLKSLAWW